MSTLPPLIRIRFYVDALNLYYGLARAYGVKWIDMEKLLLEVIRKKFPNAVAEKIIIFTSLVEGEALVRQKAYIGALQQHSPCIEMMYGWFKSVPKTGVIIDGKPQCLDSVATVLTREEKLTDVNLACRIVEDAYIEAHGGATYDICCVVTNDSDMAYALDVKRRLGQRILLITPCVAKASKKFRRRSSTELKNRIAEGDGFWFISKKLVQSCELPDPVGSFAKPAEWRSVVS